MNKRIIRPFSLLLAIILAILAIPISTANAATQTQTPQSGSYVRIRYACNGKYLDVPSESITNNGTQLQIWEYAYGNQNQIFHLYDTGEGWLITSLMSGKIVEVRNSSHNDRAEVAQWEKHNLACARWDIVANSDGTVSFRNRESGLYLNVCGGGDAPNGTKIIQYHDDNTIAMRFYLDVLSYDDVLSATYERTTIYANDLKWTRFTPYSYVHNLTDWELVINGNYYHPTPYQDKIFCSAEFLSPNTVANLILEQSYSPSIWTEIKSALAGDLSEAAIEYLLTEKLGFESVPGVGTALGILQILWDNRDADQRNRFREAVEIDAQGRYSGVIVYTYYNITKDFMRIPLNDGTTAYGYHYYIKKEVHVEYKTWTGDNFADVRRLPVSNCVGKWYYYFK